MLLGKIDQELSFNASALKLRGNRQALLTTNVVNSETPNFTAKDFNFREALQDATKMQSAGSATAGGLTQTQAGHMSGTGGAGGFSSAVQYRSASQPSIDGNSVDVDVERAELADNTVRYEASLRLLNGQLRTLQNAMQSN